jgi:hypothetical protein
MLGNRGLVKDKFEEKKTKKNLHLSSSSSSREVCIDLSSQRVGKICTQNTAVS